MGAQDRWEYSTKGAWVDITSTFAGVLLLIAGGFGVMQGVAAVADDDLYAQGSDYLYKFDMTAWGWVHIILGLMAVVVATGILMRRSWGLVTGMVVAGLSMLANFAFIPRYPFWAITLIGVNVLVLWALSNELKHVD
jgi:hypothetical protein